MPAVQKGQVDRIARGRYRLRYYINGRREAKQPFASKSAAWAWYRENVEPRVNGEQPVKPELTLCGIRGPLPGARPPMCGHGRYASCA